MYSINRPIGLIMVSFMYWWPTACDVPNWWLSAFTVSLGMRRLYGKVHHNTISRNFTFIWNRSNSQGNMSVIVGGVKKLNKLIWIEEGHIKSMKYFVKPSVCKESTGTYYYSWYNSIYTILDMYYLTILVISVWSNQNHVNGLTKIVLTGLPFTNFQNMNKI